jgi:hypothetical protein
MTVIDNMQMAGEEVPQELLDDLNGLVTAEAGKVDNCCSYIEYCKSQIEFLKNEQDIIKSLIKRYQRNIDRIKERARYVLESKGVNSIEGIRGHRFSLREIQSVDIINENLLDGEFLITSTKPDKIKIREAIKSGRSVVGATIKSSKSVVVK